MLTNEIAHEISLDERIKLLQDEDVLTANRKAADEAFKDITSAQVKHLRWRCKNDLFFLAGILGFDQLSVNLHGHFCNWLLKTRNRRFRLALLPRSHYKTTVATITDSVRIVLPDDDGTSPYPENLGTNCRVLIGHEILDQAAEFLYGISSQFLSNPWLLALFPECIPSLREQRVNKYQLELPRTQRWTEPTIGTIGVGGRSQGKHYNFLKLDDLIGAQARDSKTEMANAKSWINNIQSFFVEFTKDKLDVVGTRWAIDDLYAHVMEMYDTDLCRYIRPAEEWDEESQTLQPIFPEKFTTRSFDIIKRDPIVWNSQYANNPSAYGREFQPEWKRYYEIKPGSYNKTLIVFNGDSKEEIQVQDLDRCILIDPAMSGLAGIVVTGGTGPRIFVLDAKKDTCQPADLVDYIFQLVQKWNPRVVSIEEVLFSGIFRPWIEREMRARRHFFNVVGYKTNNKQKEVRVRGLIPYYSNGAIYHHRSQADLEKEYDGFGSTSNFHMLDALAQGPSTWSKPLTRDDRRKQEDAENSRFAEMDADTGY